MSQNSNRFERARQLAQLAHELSEARRGGDAEAAADAPAGVDDLCELILEQMEARDPDTLALLKRALRSYPNHPELMLLDVIGKLVAERPGAALYQLRRMSKLYRVPENLRAFLSVLAHAQKREWLTVLSLMNDGGWDFSLSQAVKYLPVSLPIREWLLDSFQSVVSVLSEGALDEVLTGQFGEPRARRARNKKRASTRSVVRAGARSSGSKKKIQGKKAPGKKASSKKAPGKKAPGKETPTKETPTRDSVHRVTARAEVSPEQRLPALPRLEFQIPVTVAAPDNLAMYAHAAEATPLDATDHKSGARIPPSDLELVVLRHELEQLSLLQGFDELLCLSALRDVETYWYQVETVRKVLKQFRGRVLLADEVGLGKTVEAGMVLKEYLLRGMVKRVLVLTPPSLVGQWLDEMAGKFDIPFATTHDSLLRRDSERFWGQTLVIASIATARRREHRAVLARLSYDLIIVDEAHRLKNRASLAWKLVDSLQRKFLLLLSATPVQNSLIELYNLLTLLQPGIFQTEQQFRQQYITRGQPRVPANREQMHELMRGVMIRNTRSQVDIHLPPRHAVTLLVSPGDEELACYRDLMGLIRENGARSGRRLALRHLLSAAGSSAATGAAALGRFIDSRACDADMAAAWRALHDRYCAIESSAKEAQFLELMGENPQDKKLVFVHHRETLARLSERLRRADIAHAVFEGSMSGPARDRAVEAFRTDTHVLLCTESGGEGRNLQFCNTLINFDVPWNPMAIEQRIGRLHRIGQTREVFIFNLVTRHTLEEQVLAILDEKINMFELVVGEIGLILGELSGTGEREQDFAELVFAAWTETSDADTRAAALIDLGDRLASAKSAYDASKSLDDELFGEEFVSA